MFLPQVHTACYAIFSYWLAFLTRALCCCEICLQVAWREKNLWTHGIHWTELFLSGRIWRSFTNWLQIVMVNSVTAEIYKSRDGKRNMERMVCVEQNFACLVDFGEALIIGYGSWWSVVFQAPYSWGKVPRKYSRCRQHKNLFPARNHNRSSVCPDGKLVVYWTMLAPKLVAEPMLFC